MLLVIASTLEHFENYLTILIWNRLYVYEQITENVTKQHITPSLLELHGHVGVQNVVLL
jgi:hypothetical protein